MSTPTQSRRSLQLSATGYSLVLLTVAAAILRFIFLNSKSLWQDEGNSATHAAETFSYLISELVRNEMNMALYYVTLHWWTLLAGTSEIALRLPSVIFATATVPLIYALGVELCDPRVGLMAALLLCVNVSCIEFAQEARSYAMVAMLVTLSALLFVRSIKRNAWAGYRDYVIAGPWAAYAHIFGILILPVQWLSLFVFGVDRETRVRSTVCIVVVGLLSLPVVILAILGEHGQVIWVPATSASTVLRLFAMFAGGYQRQLSGQSWVLFAIYLSVIAMAFARASSRERPVLYFLLLSVLVPVAIVLAVSIFKPLFVPRYLLSCLPFFVLLAAIGIMRIKPRSVLVAIAILIVGLSLSQDRAFYYHPSHQDWRGAVNFVASNAKPGDVLVVFPEWDRDAVNYYIDHLSRKAGFRMVVDRLSTLDGTGSASNPEADNLRRFLAAHGVDSYNRVWIVTDLKHRDEPAMRELEAGHQVTPSPHFAEVVLARID